MVGPGDSRQEVGDSGGRVKDSGERMRDSRGEDYISCGTLIIVKHHSYYNASIYIP